MDIYVTGKGKETLTKRNYIASGGEGAIYVKKGDAYKIYQKKSHVIPENKIKELSVLTSKNIIKPKSIILDMKDQPIGYTMKYIKNTVSLCQLFTKSFKDRNNIQSKDVVTLVNQFRDIVNHCHKNNILIVDLNELNFLVDSTKFDNIYFIDVDSYQTPSYPATAIMDSIKDRHAKKWDPGTDWFSFGIITFQMFIGIHPYKGKHSQYKSMDERMLNNISVLNKDVRIPPVALPMDNIPAAYKEWYKAIFEKGLRVAPPFKDINIIIPAAPAIKIVKGSSSFVVELHLLCNEDIISYSHGMPLTNEGLYVNDKTVLEFIAPYAHIIKTVREQKYISAIVKDGKLSLFDITKNKIIDSNISAEKVFSYGDRLYVKNNDFIQEIIVTPMKDKMLITLHTVCNIYSAATQIFEGVAIQDLLGSYYVSIFPASKAHYQIKVDELSGYRILNAKYEDGVLIITGEKKGVYDKFIIVFSSSYREYDIRIQSNVASIDINFTVLDNGVVVHEDHEGFIELFFNIIGKKDIKLIQDTALSGGRLVHIARQTLLIKGKRIYKVNLTTSHP